MLMRGTVPRVRTDCCLSMTRQDKDFALAHGKICLVAWIYKHPVRTVSIAQLPCTKVNYKANFGINQPAVINSWGFTVHNLRLQCYTTRFPCLLQLGEFDETLYGWRLIILFFNPESVNDSLHK